jgi:hypothetical protein
MATLVRFLSGLAAGLVISIVLSEAMLAGTDLLALDLQISSRLSAGVGLTTAGVFVVLLIWLLATTCGTAMATAVTRCQTGGWLMAVMWLLSLALIARLGGLSDLVQALAIVTWLIGALLGIRLAMLSTREQVR